MIFIMDKISITGRYLNMINREDMLELTRRMTLSRTSFDAVADIVYKDRGMLCGLQW